MYLVRYLKLYKVFILQFFKSIMQSKLDFIIGFMGFLLNQMSGIVFLMLIFEKIPMLNNWSLKQLIFIYGFSMLPKGIDHLLTDNLWILSWKMVLNGEVDRYILRPINIFFQIICEKLQPDAIGELIVGIVIVCFSINSGVINFSFITLIFMLVSIVAGAIIYTSLKLFFASLAFWFKESQSILQIIYGLSDYSKYPLEIYPKVIRIIISVIIPFALTSFLPASYFINEVGIIFIILECIIALIFFKMAYYMFNKGLDIYESSGN